MTPTERLLAVHFGEPVDRVPVSTYEMVGWNTDAWEFHEPSYARLMEYIRQTCDCLYMCHVPVANAAADRVQRTVETWDDGDQHMRRQTWQTPVGELVRVTSRSDAIQTTWTREHPVKSLDDLAGWLDVPWEPGEPDFSQLKTAWERLDRRHGLPLISFSDPICELAEAFEFGQFTIAAITETDVIAAAMDRLHERRVEMLRRILTGPVKGAVFRLVGAEYATPPYLPPELFRKFVTKYNTEYARMIREASAFPRMHSHGKTGRVVDQIAEMGVMALDPCEPPPDGDIGLAELKQAIGDRVTLCGGIELRWLEHEKESDVQRRVRETMAAGKPGGRFVIMPTAAPINIPLSPQTQDNYFRFIDTALEEGRY